MEFSCTLEASSEEIKLAKVILALKKAGYSFKSQKQEVSTNGNTLFHINLLSTIQKSQQQLEKDLSNINGCSLVKLEVGDTAVDMGETLKKIAASYPDIEQIVKIFAGSVSQESRASAVTEIGAKVGASIYARDYSLGSPLAMPAALHRELVPALKVFSTVDAFDTSVKLLDCPFCAKRAGEVSTCEFITGYIRGFMDANPATPNCEVKETSCGSGTDSQCAFSVEVP